MRRCRFLLMRHGPLPPVLLLPVLPMLFCTRHFASHPFASSLNCGPVCYWHGQQNSWRCISNSVLSQCAGQDSNLDHVLGKQALQELSNWNLRGFSGSVLPSICSVPATLPCFPEICTLLSSTPTRCQVCTSFTRRLYSCL